MNKPNVMNPHIIVTYHSDKPYYEILYYDVDKKDWMCGYGSFNPEFVKEWFENDLNILTTEQEFIPKVYGKWIYHNFEETQDRLDYEEPFECSVCKHRQGIMTYKFCPNCGTEMLRDNEEVIGNGNIFKGD